MPWNGSGVFNLVFNWPTDAANSIPISSPRMQTQEQDIATGLQNCLTLDGQTTPIADISWGTHKITNLATPTGAADAVNKSYVDGAVPTIVNGPFLPFTGTFTWVSGFVFKVIGQDATAIMTAGRRLKIVHTTGAVTNYYTIISSSFAAGDTTVNLGPGPLATASTITAVSVSLNSGSAQWPSTVGSIIQVNSGSQNLTSGATANVALNSASFDLLGEVSGGVITVKTRGYYMLDVLIEIDRNGATYTGALPFLFDFGWAGTASATLFAYISGSLTGTAWTTLYAQYKGPQLFNNSSLQFLLGGTNVTFTGGPMKAAITYAVATRLY